MNYPQLKLPLEYDSAPISNHDPNEFREYLEPLERTLPSDGKTLLSGRPYTNAAQTDVRKTWMAHGWTPPSEQRGCHEQ